MFLSQLKQSGLLWSLSRHLLHTQLDKVSATESASVLHLHPYKSKASVWREHKEPKPWTLISQPVPAPLAHGNLYERDAVVAGLSIISAGQGTVSWCVPGILLGVDGVTCCSPDALWKDSQGGWHGLEVKCPYNPENIPTPETALVQDPHYLLQAFHCLHTSDCLDWYLFYYDPRNLSNRRLIRIGRNEALWQSILTHYRSFLSLTSEPNRKTKYDRLVGETILNRLKTELVE
jgi:hypothetical protein